MLHTVSIITTDANKQLSWLHDRMPVLLADEKASQLWLSVEGTDWKKLDKLLRPYSGEDLMFHPVTTKMGSVTFQGKECCQDIRKHGLESFFTPKKRPGKREAFEEDMETTAKKKVKLEVKKEVKTEVKTEPSVKLEEKTMKKESSTNEAFTPDRKRVRKAIAVETSPTRKSARLMSKAVKKE